jgi:hypothetical protein
LGSTPARAAAKRHCPASGAAFTVRVDPPAICASPHNLADEHEAGRFVAEVVGGAEPEPGPRRSRPLELG